MAEPAALNPAIRTPAPERDNPDLSAGSDWCPATLSVVGICALIAASTIPGPAELLNARLFDWGAQNHASVAAGEWWRLLTSTFLHRTWVHLLSNLYFLYAFGAIVETLFGPARFFAIFVLASVAASIASYAFSGGMSVGSSGAVFGLLGAILASGRRGRANGLTPEVWILFLMWAGYNLLEGFKTPEVDNAAHIGGFVGGAVAAALLIGRPLTFTVVALCVAALAWSGFQVLRSEKVTSRVAAYRLGVAASKAGELDAAEQDFTRAAPFLPALIDRSALRIRRGELHWCAGRRRVGPGSDIRTNDRGSHPDSLGFSYAGPRRDEASGGGATQSGGCIVWPESGGRGGSGSRSSAQGRG
jgi:membrane associated rhomboid family serine protease